jgi:hypothetical protein
MTLSCTPVGSALSYFARSENLSANSSRALLTNQRFTTSTAGIVHHPDYDLSRSFIDILGESETFKIERPEDKRSFAN